LKGGDRRAQMSLKRGRGEKVTTRSRAEKGKDSVEGNRVGVFRRFRGTCASKRSATMEKVVNLPTEMDRRMGMRLQKPENREGNRREIQGVEKKTRSRTFINKFRLGKRRTGKHNAMGGLEWERKKT